MLLRWNAAVLLIPLLVIAGAIVRAQDFEVDLEEVDWEFVLAGNTDDFRMLPMQDRQHHEFTWVRLIYNGRIRGYIKNWYTDYPKGDRHLIRMLRRLTGIDIAPQERAVPIHHPDLFSYPMIYSCEAGQMVLDESEAGRLREYLERGGFWMIDDFWGSFEWASFEKQIGKVLPGHDIVDIPAGHPIFHTVFDIHEVLQVPNIGYAYCPSCPTWELDGYEPHVRGIFNESGRLMVFINFNTDLMDASEWSDHPLYPQKFSRYAYKIFTNAVVYAMSY